ncbi:hypothetical protein [Peribacillus loiseleuriae]|uniref:hypothetical protein n=1 Tax=Peribacillus loiseleuriae TaxID=1679170 RepID=UPI003CFF0D01
MLVTEKHLRRILSYFKAIVATKNAFVSNECFNKDHVIENDDVKKTGWACRRISCTTS